jgi:hypothetical protein
LGNSKDGYLRKTINGGQKKALHNVKGKRETSMHQPDIDGERLHHENELKNQTFSLTRGAYFNDE